MVLSQVFPAKLYIGDRLAARDRPILLHSQITHIVNLVGRNYEHFPDTFTYLTLDFHDTDAEDFTPAFGMILSWIHAHLDHGDTVLIHCLSGRSRSGAILVAYFATKYGLTVDRALKAARELYPRCKPRPTFRKQLQAVCRQEGALFVPHQPGGRIPYCILILAPTMAAQGHLLAQQQAGRALDPRFGYIIRTSATVHLWIGPLCPAEQEMDTALNNYYRYQSALGDTLPPSCIDQSDLETYDLPPPRVQARYDHAYRLLCAFLAIRPTVFVHNSTMMPS